MQCAVLLLEWQVTVKRHHDSIHGIEQIGRTPCSVASGSVDRDSLFDHQRTAGLPAMATTMPTATITATMTIRIRA